MPETKRSITVRFTNNSNTAFDIQNAPPLNGGSWAKGAEPKVGDTVAIGGAATYTAENTTAGSIASGNITFSTQWGMVTFFLALPDTGDATFTATAAQPDKLTITSSSPTGTNAQAVFYIANASATHEVVARFLAQ